MFARRWLIGLAGAAAVAALGAGALAVNAQSQADSGTPFLDRVAAKLGIDTPKLEQAIKDSRTDQIDERVAAGDLTQEEADKFKERLDEAPDDGLGGRDRFGFEFRRGHGGFKFGMFGGGSIAEMQQKLADFLAIPTDTLADELQADGATLATVAEAHGKSRDDLKTFIRDEAKARFDASVADGTLTQAQADAALAKLDAHVDTLIDHPLFGGRGPHMRPFLPGGGEGTMDGPELERGGAVRLPALRS